MDTIAAFHSYSLANDRLARIEALGSTHREHLVNFEFALNAAKDTLVALLETSPKDSTDAEIKSLAFPSDRARSLLGKERHEEAARRVKLEVDDFDPHREH